MFLYEISGHVLIKGQEVFSFQILLLLTANIVQCKNIIGLLNEDEYSHKDSQRNL